MRFRITGRVLGLVLTAGVVLLAVSSCTQPTSGPTVQTIKWQSNSSGSAIEFSTNNSSYYNYGFYDPLTQETWQAGTADTATVEKVSGATNVGYGMIFSYQSTGNYYALLIDAQDQYAVFKSVSGTTTNVTGWTPAPSGAPLKSGVGATNTISVTQTGTGTYSISFNGKSATTYSDTSGSSFTGGDAGFYAGIGSSSDESFPTTPETIDYTMTSPNPYN